MKSKNFILTAMLMASPSVMMAQQNIQKAFDALLNDNIVEIKTHHSTERDPETGKKEAQADVYDLMITDPAVMHHIKDIQKAFEKDNDKAYQLRTVSHAGSDYTSLAVGNGRKQSVAIGKMKGSDYIYACFLDKDDPEKKYRYAYAMEWLEKDKKTHVRLAVTYATTQQYRESKRHISRITVNGNDINIDGNGFSFGDGFPLNGSFAFGTDSISSFPLHGNRDAEQWLSEFNIYKNLFMRKPNGHAASQYATYIYKLCKKADKLEDAEKKMVAAEIKKLKNKTKDEFIQELFDMSVERLKK